MTFLITFLPMLLVYLLTAIVIYFMLFYLRRITLALEKIADKFKGDSL